MGIARGSIEQKSCARKFRSRLEGNVAFLEHETDQESEHGGLGITRRHRDQVECVEALLGEFCFLDGRDFLEGLPVRGGLGDDGKEDLLLKEDIHLLPDVNGEGGIFETENDLENAGIDTLGAFA